MLKPKPGVDTIQPYQGGKPIEEVQRELGITDIIKLASNENPLGPSPLAVQAIAKSAAQVHLYPDGNAYYLKRELAAHIGVSDGHLILGNGSNDVLQLIAEAYIAPGDEVIYAAGAFVVYSLVTKLCGATAVVVPMVDDTHDLSAMAAAITDKTKVIFIANPNNPTGTMVTADETAAFMEQVPADVLVVFDEAYYEYVARSDYPQTLPYVLEGRNFIITRTFSKIYGLAGLRIGYGIAPPPLVETLNRVRQPFNCSLVGQAAARAALKDTAHVKESQRSNAAGKVFLYKAFDDMGLRYIETEGNFIMLHVEQSGAEITDALLKQGVIVRPMAGYGYPNTVRVTIGTQQENERFIKALKVVSTQLRVPGNNSLLNRQPTTEN
ncbi:histidinol-phosphate transaminase [Candidatus Poribacteria bacterium]|nr:histidinol-phosphate transaminase [Candidatus Poribacteria bacterium]MYH80952.1 histidinol-phosphate transaminase [Candidatus Poribacteria bacterium]MYK92712.1 histidinol-phosphate transaminase [Candidatus Poribacteria bacterium]